MEKLYHQILDGIQDAYVAFDFGWKICHANSRAETWGHFLLDDVKGRIVWEVFPILTQSPLCQFYHQSMSSRQPASMEYLSPTTQRWYMVRTIPTVQGLAICMTDINDQKKIADGHDQFRVMANAIPQLGWMADPEGFIYWYNDRWHDYTGTTLEQMRGWGWQQLQHPDHLARVLDEVSRAWQQTEPWEMTFPIRGHDGTYRWFLTRVFPVKDASGALQQWIGTNTDIHDQQQNAQLPEQMVVQRTAELTAANEHLRSVNEELRQFNYAASHDLQEPLRKIKIFTESIRSQDFDKLGATSQLFLERTAVSVERMSNLLKDLLDYSSAGREDHFRTVDLNEILAEVELDLELLIAQRSARIQQERLPVIRAIPLQMHQLFYNLLHNAIKFVPPDRRPLLCVQGSELSVNAWGLPADRRYLYLTIADNGIGFEAEYSEKIFELFKRLHSQQAFQGTGVGLALCKKVIENHQGRIWAESTLGQGATFHVVLPIEQASPPAA